ncbi:MAG: hypothetical protein ACE369_14190 [Roseovarius sp.]
MRPGSFVFGAAVVLGLALPDAARAEGCFGPGTPLFHCTMNKGATALDLCLQGTVVIYRFGPSGGAADLLQSHEATRVDMTPWPGVGRTIWEDTTLENEGFRYVVHRATDRMIAEDDPDYSAAARGGVEVSKDGRVVSDRECDAGSVTVADFYPLYEAKEAAGQCWNRDTFSWGAC